MYIYIYLYMIEEWMLISVLIQLNLYLNWSYFKDLLIDKLIMSQEQLTLKGTLEGHNGWVTQIATNHNFPNMILSASRG